MLSAHSCEVLPNLLHRLLLADNVPPGRVRSVLEQLLRVFARRRLGDGPYQDEEVVEEDVRKEEVDVEDRTTRRDLSGHSSPEDHITVGRAPKEARDETRLEEGDKADRQEETSKKDQQRATNTNATKENQESLPVADYDDLTVEEAKERLDGLSEGELRKIRSYEKKHKNRNTLLRWLDRRIKKVSRGGQESKRA